MKISYIAFVLIFYLPEETLCQVETINLTDSSPPSSFSFDQSFKIVYTPSGKGKHKASSVYLIELNKCGCMVPFDCCDCKDDNFCNRCNDRACQEELDAQKKKKVNPQNKEQGTPQKETPVKIKSILSGERIASLDSILKKKEIKYSDTLKKTTIESMEDAIDQKIEGKEDATTKCLWAIQPFFSQPDSGAVNISIPALRPNKRFMMVITWQGKPAGIDEVVDLLINKPDQAEEAYKKVAKDAEFVADNGVACSGCAPHFAINEFSDFVAFAKTDLTPTLYLIQLVKTDIKNSKTPTMTKISGAFDLGLIGSIIQFSQECLQCQDTLWQQSWISNNRLEFSRTLVNLPLLKDDWVTFGYSAVNEVNVSSPKSEIEVAKRILNIEKTVKWASTVLEFIRYHNIKKYGNAPSPHSGLINDLEDAIKTLWDNHKLLVDHKKTMDELTSELRRLNAKKDKILSNWEGFTQAYASTTASTFSYNFDTRAGFYIKSDFGFMAFSENNKLSGFAPFLGFHLNFRPMNTDVPYKNIRCKGWGILSFHSGLLLGSFKKENERTGLIGNNAVFTGLGVALNHGVRITSGSIWYKQKGPSPLVSDYKTKASFYVGVAIDLRLKDIYGSFKNVFAP